MPGPVTDATQVAAPPAPLDYAAWKAQQAAPDTAQPAPAPPSGPMDYATWKAAQQPVPRVITSPTSTAEAANIHALNALTFGLGTRAAAALVSLVQRGNLSEYDAVRLAEDARLAQQQKEHPVASGVGTVAGAVASPLNFLLPGGSEATSAAGLAGRLAAGGAVAGGVTGATSTPASGTTGDMVRNGLLGAGTGAVTGGLLGAGIGAARGLLSPTARIAQAAAQSPGGVAALPATAAGLQDAGVSPTLSMLSPQLAAEAQRAAKVSPLAATALQDQAREAPERVLAYVRSMVQSQATPATPDPLAAIAAKIRAQAPNATDAEIAYAAKQMGVTTPPGVADPKVEAAIKAANKGWHAIDPKAMQQTMATMDPTQQSIVRQTIANQLVEQLESAGTSEKAAADLIAGAKPNSLTEQKLALAFPDKPTLDAFIQRMEVERALRPDANPPNHVTALLGQLASVAGGAGLGHFLHSPVAAIGSVVTGAAPLAYGMVNRGVSTGVGDMLSRQGPDAIVQLIGKLNQAAPGALHPAVQAALRGGAGQLGGRAGLLAPQGQAPGQATGLLAPPAMGP